MIVVSDQFEVGGRQDQDGLLSDGAGGEVLGSEGSSVTVREGVGLGSDPFRSDAPFFAVRADAGLRSDGPFVAVREDAGLRSDSPFVAVNDDAVYAPMPPLSL